MKANRLPAVFLVLSCFLAGIACSVDREIEPSPLNITFVAVDIETTGFSPDACRVVELGVVRFKGPEIGAHWEFIHSGSEPRLPRQPGESEMVCGAEGV